MAHVFRNDVIEWFVGADLADARAAAEDFYRNTVGEMPESYNENIEELRQEPDDKLLTMEDDDGTKVSKTCAEWAATLRHGFLGTTEV